MNVMLPIIFALTVQMIVNFILISRIESLERRIDER